MKCDCINKRWIIVCCASLIAWSSLNVQAQVSRERLAQMQSKYDWGSIYLSYGNIPDIIHLLDNSARLERIRATFQSAPPTSMIAFFSRYRSPGLRNSVILFQINFTASTPVAGYLTSSDYHGTINRIPMPPAEVLAAANWTDLYLTHAAEWWRLSAGVFDGSAGLRDAWALIGQVSNDPFISENRISSLLIAFRQNQLSKAAELESMKTTDAHLYEKLTLFASNYDALTTAYIQKFWSQQPPQNNQAHQEDRERTTSLYRSQLPLSRIDRVLSAKERAALEDSFRLQIYQEYRKILERKP